MNAVTSGRDLLDQAKVLAKYLRDQPGGWLAGHHLLKSVRWDTLTELPPLDAAGRTRLVPPKPDHKAHLKRLYLQKSWLELLEHTDTLLAQGVNHLWLDVQWYAWQALVKQDHDSVRADIICRDLEGLLARLPGLEALAFNDGTPFADEVTLNWINETVLDAPSGWNNDPVMALTAGDDDVLALEPEVMAKADGEGIEAALNWLQLQPGYTSARDRWLMRLLMARVSEQYGKHEMALHLLGELDGSARALTLEQWTPELIFEVKARRLKLLRGKAGRNEADKTRLQPEMDALLAGLIALDPARAAVLCG
jgi:type VI secretion system protein VasJ